MVSTIGSTLLEYVNLQDETVEKKRCGEMRISLFDAYISQTRADDIIIIFTVITTLESTFATIERLQL